jgi:hypothetical protein
VQCKRLNVVTVAANRIQVYGLVWAYLLRLQAYDDVSFSAATPSCFLLGGQRILKLIQDQVDGILLLLRQDRLFAWASRLWNENGLGLFLGGERLILIDLSTCTYS